MIDDLFQTVDASFAWLLGNHARLALWSIASGTLSMLLYKFTSPQQKIRELDVQAAGIRQALAKHDGEFNEALPLIRSNLAVALTRLRVALAPSLLAGAPIVLCLIGLDAAYAEFEFVPLGPNWLRWWVVGYFILSSAAALTTKFALRIK